MSGRENIKKFSFFINSACGIFAHLPVVAQEFLWSISGFFSGRLSLLTRYAYLKSLACCVGENVYVGKFVIFKSLSRISLGENVSIHDGCYIDAIGGGVYW